MPGRVAVLDACILVPAGPRDTLLRAAQAGLYEARWSDVILEEVRRTLVRERMSDERQAQHLLTTLRREFPRAIVQGFERHIGRMTNHPKDRHVLAVGVESGASMIITNNLRDFPMRSLAPVGIIAQSPDAFLRELFINHARVLASIIRRQGAALRTPRTPEQVLDSLARQDPRTFADGVRQWLAEHAADE